MATKKPTPGGSARIFTLEEVASRLGDGITAASLVRRGTDGSVLICAHFAGRYYSPVHQRDIDVNGWYLIPPLHLAEIDAKGETRCQAVTNGAQMIFPNVAVRADQLRMTDVELQRLQTPQAFAGHASPNKAQDKLAGMRKLRAEGISDTEIGKRNNISRQRVAQLIGSKTKARLDAVERRRK